MSEFQVIFIKVKQVIIEFLPTLFFVFLILLVGLVIARLSRYLILKFLKNIHRFIPSKKIKGILHSDRLENASKVVSNLFYWTILFFFLTIATEIIGLPVITTWFSGLVNYLPKILVAVLIGIIGIFGGIILRDIISSTANSAGIAYGEVLGKLGQYSIIFITILVGIDQIGVDIAFLTNLLLIILAAFLFGAALAFGLGAKTSVSNILAVYYLQKVYKIGDMVNIGNQQGKIIQILPHAIILEHEHDQIYIPASYFNENLSITRGKE
jgi:small-conductance mechanosensitive channel